MGEPTPPTPNWGVIGQLYDELAAIEQRRPGSPRARDVEDAITLLLDGRVTSSHPQHLRHDAVRRARFLRRQADRQRPVAMARLMLPASASAPPNDEEEGGDGLAEPYHHITPEAVVCARETVLECSRPAERGSGVHAAGVLTGLLADQTASSIAADLGISRSTVDRCIAGLRLTVLQLTAAA
jgi:hypothetical protein